MSQPSNRGALASAPSAEGPRQSESGLTLLEALVATAIITMASLVLFGIRTTAVRDALHATQWRTARELAQARLSELLAGAHEAPPEGAERIAVPDYEGFEIQVVYGESSIDAVRNTNQENASELEEESGGWSSERSQMQRERDMLRRAQRSGVSRWELEDQLFEEEQQRLEEQEAPSETQLEDIAVFVYFPKADPNDQGEEVLELRARISTLAWSGMTPEAAARFAEAQGLTPADGSTPPADPSGDGGTGNN